MITRIVGGRSAADLTTVDEAASYVGGLPFHREWPYEYRIVFSPTDVIDFLETLPAHETHCAELAVGAFYLALAKHQEHRNAPWKKPYQKR